MSDLHIPDVAWRAAGEAVDAIETEHGVRVKGRGAIAPIVNAAAPHIVAAELRRLARADELRNLCDQWGGMHIDEVEELLLNRAEDLDGGVR